MNAGEENTSFGPGAAGIALAASALSEAAQALSEAAAALSAMGQNENASSKGYKSFESTTQGFDSHEADKEKDHVREIDDDDAGSVDANTGNNLYRKDATPESNTMTPHIGGTAHVASQSQAQQEPHGGHKQPSARFLDGLLYPGRFYIVLEEEFDALPLVFAYATIGKRTICYVPTSGSLLPWESIISAIIPGREVRSAVSFSGNSILQLSEVVEKLASSNDGSVLILRPSFISQANQTRAHSTSESVIFWGLPGPKYWPDIIDTIQQSRHALLVLSRREYLDPACQAFFTECSGFVLHPRNLDLSSFENTNIFADFRNSVHCVLSRHQHSLNIQSIYEGLLQAGLSDMTRLGFVTRNPSEKIDLVNKYIARVFLRGRTEDGSPRFRPDGQGLQVPDRIMKKLGTLPSDAAQVKEIGQRPAADQSNAVSGDIQGAAMNTPRSLPPHTNVAHSGTSPPTSYYNIPSNSNPAAFTHRPGRWRITLLSDADTIPLIFYLAEQHRKSVCAISHSQTTIPYENLFSKISKYGVVATGKKLRSVEKALGQFSSGDVRSGLCLLRGHSTNGEDRPHNFDYLRADALIYWGLPTSNSFLWPSRVTQNQFTHVYLIISPNQVSLVNSLTGTTFPEHPDAALLNARGHDTLLHPMREKTKLFLWDMDRATVRIISQFYKPAHSSTYPVYEFLKRVMLQSGY